ncbi:MAG: hypothetical protein FVQ85_05140 [Planctomycetes bacterium]|nr:hypothetical protein [Planctomycetota bacterium]
MEKAAGHILKSNDVKLEGQFCLDAEQTASNSVNKPNKASSELQVRIVENHPEYAVIEATCCCGTKTLIKCEFTEAQSTKQEPTK